MNPDVDLVERVRGLCGQLEAQPLFHASLGSKELFHSNLIAWFVDHHRDAAGHVFSSWSRSAPGTKEAKTERERHHLDFVVHLKDAAPLVVENKVFSPPRDGQLVEYAEKVAPRYTPQPEFVLLSLSDPGWFDRQRELGGHLWRYRSYGELGAAMAAASSDVVGTYDQATVQRYALMVQLLQDLTTIVTVDVTDSTPFAIPAAFHAELDNVGLGQGFEKLRSRAIAQYIQERLSTHQLDVGVVDGYTRTWPILEAFTRVPGTDDEIGWQYQEGQWRLAVRVLPDHRCYGKGDAARTQREQYVTAHYKEWFDFSETDPVLGTTASDAPMATGFRRFDPNFVYLYRKVQSATAGQLCTLAEVTARRAQAFVSGMS